MKFFKSRKCLIYLFLFLILIIRIFYSVYLFNYKYKFSERKYIEMKIISLKNVSDKTISYIGKIKYSSKFIDKFIVYVPNDNSPYLNNGDIISFYSKLNENKFYNNYNEFNYGLYLNSQNIVGTVYADSYNVIYKSDKKWDFRTKFGEYLNNNFNEDISSVISAIIYGNKGNIGKETEEIFKLSGASHILVVSGTAIYILRGLLNKILKRFKYKNICVFILVTLYMIFCIKSVSLIRAYIMYLIGIIFKILKFKEGFFDRIIFSLIIVMIINPYYIFSYSLWYSFLAVLGIKIFYPLIQSKLNNFVLRVFKCRCKSKIKQKKLYIFITYLISIISITISVQIMLFPIMIFSCNKIYLITIISNLVVSPIIILEYLLGFTLVITFYIPFLSNLVSYILNIVTNILLCVIGFFAKFDFLNISINKISIISTILIYVFIFINLYGHIFFITIKYRFGKNISKTLKIFIYWIIILVVGINIVYSNFIGFVYFFNVGQGNMTLIKYDNIVIVSDIGSITKNVDSILLNFCSSYNICKINYLFLSHMHSDHINGLFQLETSILNGKIKIDNIVVSYVNEEVKDLCKRLNINLIEVKRYDNMRIGKDIEVNILSPDIERCIKSNDIENSNSLVYEVNVKNKRILFTGDATKETERDILEEKFETRDYFALQVAHHGSNTSSSKEFLKYFTFKNAVISSEKRVYGHPSYETLEMLNIYVQSCYILEEYGGKRLYIY